MFLSLIYSNSILVADEDMVLAMGTWPIESKGLSPVLMLLVELVEYVRHLQMAFSLIFIFLTNDLLSFMV